MWSDSDQDLAVGARVRVRGDDWTVVSITVHADCQSLRLSGIGAGNAGLSRTLLLPFDRPEPLRSISRIRAATRRRWARHLALTLVSAHPFGGMRAAAQARFDLLPFQLEPALAMLRHGRLRVLVADEVGLGKTIQTGIMLNELAAADATFRALVVTPAGVREQWQRELQSRFSLNTTLADAAWLAVSARDLPPDVNPWSLPGIYVASLDLVKRPEVLRALEDVTWDLAVIDEVHGAGPGTARLAAAHALGARSRRVVLLTATPPDSDPAHFAAVAGIGRAPGTFPLTEFRRTRADAGVAARRRSVLFPVRLSATERTMHRLLGRYTSLVWSDAGARQDWRARLSAVVLRKRALSSAASLASSVRRRLALLGAPPSEQEQERQLLLPLLDEDPMDDETPDDVMGAVGLADTSHERACLEEIARVAERASRDESKLQFLLRLLARVREPALVFTEYRDTLAQIAAAVSPGIRVLLLHGALTPRERGAAQRAFNTSGALLLATDAASEGLNLHDRCRLVIHFELPWTPARLEQRTGRVDRLGQRRTVHEILLVANDTAERLVLAPLLKRARIAAARRGRPLTVLDESAVAAALMEGVPVEQTDAGPSIAAEPMDLKAEAEAEARRLSIQRTLSAAASVVPCDRKTETSVTAGRRPSNQDVLCVVLVTIEDANGRAVHAELVPVSLTVPRATHGRAARDLVKWASNFVQRNADAIFDEARRHCWDACADAMVLFREGASAAAARERAIAAGLPSTAQPLVQAGLFDRRAVTDARVRRQITAVLAGDAESRARLLQPDIPLRTTARIVGIHSGWRRR